MAFSTLSDTLIQVAKPTKREIFTTLKNNQDDHETRVSALEVGASKVFVLDEIIELDRPRVGDVKFSFLTETQFQTQFGTDWVLIDGSSISGSDLESLYGATLPDGRDRFPRILGGAKAVGDTETNQNKIHDHGGSTGAGGSCEYGGGASPYGVQAGGQIGNATHTHTISGEGGTEARPDSLVLNAFTRKNDYEIDQVKLWRAPFNFVLTSAIITTLNAGTSGTLEIDLKKGSSLGSLTTVFSTKPSVLQSAGNNASSSNAAFSAASVVSNDWLQVDITSLQVQQYRFHVRLIGELA